MVEEVAGDDYRKINQNRRVCNHELYEEVAEELQLPIELVKEIIEANSQFIRKTIERGAFESVTLPYLGKVKAKLRSVQKATSLINRK